VSNEDLQQIAAIVAAAEQRIDQRIKERLTELKDSLTELIRNVETRLLTELESLSRRTERIDSMLSGVLAQMVAITKSLSQR